MNLLLTLLLTMKCWRIPGWWVHHENNKSRDIDTLSYHLQPNDMDGLVFGYLRALPDGWEIYGLFGGFKMLCSKSQPIEARRGGWLYRNGTILTVDIMSGMLAASREKVIRALTVLSTPPADWMAEEELPAMTPELRTTPGGHSKGTPPTPGGHSKGRKPAVLNDVLKTHSLKDTHTIAPGAPAEAEVRQWATHLGIPPDFAWLKIEQAVERKDFVKKIWQDDWQSKMERFWKEDGAVWMAKNQKKRRAPGAKPADWQAGDAEQWWTDSLADVRASLEGALLGQDQKNAARLREIIASRAQEKT